MILFESFLSSLGTQEPLSSWGALLSDGAPMEVSPWLLLFPAGFVVTLFCFNFIMMACDAPRPKDRYEYSHELIRNRNSGAATGECVLLEVNDSCYVRYLMVMTAVNDLNYASRWRNVRYCWRV